MHRIGGLERLGPEDERILTLERGTVAGHMCKVLIVEPPPDGAALTVQRLREALSARLALAPQCTRRVQALPRGLGRPVWVADTRFDICNHVNPASGETEPLSEPELRTLIATLMTQRLDRTRPLWALDVASLEANRKALIWRVHHCMADGMTALRLGEQLLWSSEVSSARTERTAPAVTTAVAARDLLMAAAADQLRAGLAVMRRAAMLGSQPSRWRTLVSGAKEIPGTIRRELAPSAVGSPFDAPAGTRRAVAWTSTSLTGLHSAIKAIEPAATVNDAVVSLVASGVKEWLTSSGRTIPSIRVRIPVSLHRSDDEDHVANRDSFLDVDVPLDASSIDQLRAVSRQTAERKRHHDAEHLDRLFREVGALPFGSHALAMTGGPHEFSLCVSNVPGPKEPIFVLGGRVAELYSVVEIAPRHALRVSVISNAGRLTFTLCANPDVVDQSIVVRGIERGLEEINSWPRV